MRIGIADTTFSRIDMGKIAIETIKNETPSAEIERYTVPGFKDLAVACKKLIEEYKCSIVIALGWVGGEEIDETCAHEANVAIMNVEVLTGTHILKVFVHCRESPSDQELMEIATDRVQKHALNALALLKGKEALTPYAGKGLRQGKEDRGAL